MLSIENIASHIVSNALKKAIALDAEEEFIKVFNKLDLTDESVKTTKSDIDTLGDDVCDTNMTYAEFLSKKRTDFIRENDCQIIKDAENKERKLCAKIRSYMNEKMTDDEISEFTFERILDDIMTNTMVRSIFRKDPVRQSIHEKSQIEWIRKKLLPDVVKLNGARGGLYFSNHQLSIVHPRPIGASKTLDIYSAETNTYGVLKFSTAVGGAQDNQFTDVKIFIHQIIGYMNSSSYSSERFMFFLDGPYYTEKKMNSLRMMIPNDKSEQIIITSVERI